MVRRECLLRLYSPPRPFFPPTLRTLTRAPPLPCLPVCYYARQDFFRSASRQTIESVVVAVVCVEDLATFFLGDSGGERGNSPRETRVSKTPPLFAIPNTAVTAKKVARKSNRLLVRRQELDQEIEHVTGTMRSLRGAGTTWRT